MAAAAGALRSKPTEEVKALADSGDAEAQLELGYRHHTGRDAAKDVLLAFDCFLAAATAGQAEAQFEVALRLERGQWLPADRKKDVAAAREWYTKAADQQNPKAVKAMARLNKETARAQEEEEQEGKNKTAENLHLWEDKIGKTWEWRAKPKMLNSEWKTIWLDPRGKCVIKEGVKKTVKSTAEYEWDVADNADFWADSKGKLIIPFERGGKPILYYSRAEFEKEYPAEMNAAMH